MSGILVDTSQVRTTATNIKAINGKINDDFKSMEKKINKLNSSWDSQAADVVINKFYEIKANLYESRKKEVNNMAEILLHQIAEGYEHTEKANTDLGKLFL